MRARRTAGVAFGPVVCLSALLLVPTRAAVAQSAGPLSTLNILHQLSFQYPSSWALIPGSTHLPTNPQSDSYGNNEALELKSPDDVVEIWLFVDPQISGPATTALQNIFDNLSSDPSSYPNFQVISTPETQSIAGADSGSQGQASWSIGGEVQNVHHTKAIRGDTLYNLELVWTAGQLQFYQSQIQAIGASFQLLS